MDHIKNVLNKRVKKLNIKPKVQAVGVIEKYNNIIRQEMGEQIAQRVQASFLKNNYLYVTIKSSAASNEVRLREDKILEKLNTNGFHVKGIIYIG